MLNCLKKQKNLTISGRLSNVITEKYNCETINKRRDEKRARKGESQRKREREREKLREKESKRDKSKMNEKIGKTILKLKRKLGANF